MLKGTPRWPLGLVVIQEKSCSAHKFFGSQEYGNMEGCCLAQMPSFCLERGQRSCVFPAYILNLLKFPVLLRLSGSFMNVFCFSEAVSTCSLRLKEHENGLEIYRCFRVHLRWIQGLWKKGRRPGGTAQFTFLADPISPVCCYSRPHQPCSLWTFIEFDKWHCYNLLRHMNSLCPHKSVLSKSRFSHNLQGTRSLGERK